MNSFELGPEPLKFFSEVQNSTLLSYDLGGDGCYLLLLTTILLRSTHTTAILLSALNSESSSLRVPEGICSQWHCYLGEADLGRIVAVQTQTQMHHQE